MPIDAGKAAIQDKGPARRLDEQACRMICSISSGMLGVCLTGIGLIRVIISVRHRETLADDFLAFNALCFLCTLMTSYFAIRFVSIQRFHRLEMMADSLFIFSMTVLVLNCFYITYSISLR